MIREDDLPKIFGALFEAVKSILVEYKRSRGDLHLNFILLPNSIFKVKGSSLTNSISLQVNLSSDGKSFDVEHSRLASPQSDSETQTRKIIPIVEGDGEVRFRYEDGEPMSVEETARSLMQPFLNYDRL